MKTLVSAAVFAALTTTAIAEPITIFISGNRSETPGLGIPAATKIISSDEIEKSGASSLADILKSLSFIQVRDTQGGGGNAAVDMRGFGENGAYNTVILIDGIKLNPSADQSAPNLNVINPDSIARIEIIKGSSGTLYGNQAVGGVINIISKKPSDLNSTLKVEAGSFNSKIVTANINGAISEQNRFALNAYKNDSDNYRNHNATSTERKEIKLDLSHDRSKSQISLIQLDEYLENSGALDNYLKVYSNPKYSAPRYNGDFYDENSQIASIKNTYKASEKINLINEFSITEEKSKSLAYASFLNNGNGGYATTLTNRNSKKANPRVSYIDSSWNVTSGIDLSKIDYETLTDTGYSLKNEQSLYALYSQFNFKINSMTNITSGARRSFVNNKINGAFYAGNPIIKDAQSASNIGINHQLSETLEISARHDKNFRYAVADEHSNMAGITSHEVKTQTGASNEVQVKWHNDDNQLAVQFFTLDLEDEIIFDGKTFANANLDSTSRKGISVDIGAKLGRSLKLNFSYDYLIAEIDNATFNWTDYDMNWNPVLATKTISNKTIPLIPKHSAFASLNWSPKSNLNHLFTWKYTGSRYIGADFDNEQPKLSGFSTFDLASTYKNGNWNFTFNIENILDKREAESASLSGSGIGYYPITERNFMLSAKYTFE